jgi:PAS domain S-box-containing protein
MSADRRSTREDSAGHERDLLAALLDVVGALVLVLDREGRVVRFNRFCEDLTGYRFAEVENRYLWDVLLLPEETEPVRGVFANLVAGLFPNRFENHWRTKDGGRRLIAWSNTALVGADGRVEYVIGTGLDVTEQRQAEEELRRSEAQYRALVEQAGDGIFVADEQMHYVDVNQRGCEMLGYTREEIVAVSASDLLPAEDLATNPIRIEDLLSGRPVVNQRRMRRKDGSIFPVEVSARRLPDGRFLGMVRDITERKRTEQRLAESERYLERAQELAHVGTWDADLATYTATFSEEMARIFGLPTGPYTVTYQEFVARIHPEDRARVEEQIRLAIEHPSTTRYENRVVRPDGSVRVVEATSEPVLDASGKVTRIIGSAQDITARRFLERQLREAQKLEAIGRLAGGVAHDFNNLLTVILGYAETLLADLPSADPGRPSVEQIRLAARRAASLTQQLLAFGRRQLLQPSVFDLNAVVVEMREILRRLIGEHIDIATSPGARDSVVRADRGQIEQVIMNLALNARDAMPDGGRLDISTRNLEAPLGEPGAAAGLGQPSLLLAVSDTGVGMSPEVQAHIFEPFFSTKEVGQGTGLGLATVYGIVTQTGGRIEVTSAPGEGSTFRIYLPCVRAEAGPEDAMPPAGELGGSETVLLVEDEGAVRGLLAEVLRRRGYRVLEAADGREAAEVAARHPGALHLLLTDVVIPGMSGQELARRLESERPGLRVMFISGYSDKVAGERGVAVAAAFLQKPFTPSALARKVREVLDAPPQWAVRG